MAVNIKREEGGSNNYANDGVDSVVSVHQYVCFKTKRGKKELENDFGPGISFKIDWIQRDFYFFRQKY